VKNVGIIHNREFETGSLRIDLHSERDVQAAKEALEAHGYEVTVG
jgi:prephenate dehydrogenase